jgi:hypothetical protein
MARQKMVGGTYVDLTPEEETARDAEEQAWADGASAREMTSIREHRDRLLTETDWMANSDVTMSDEWKTYRQELRDIPASNTVYEDVTWPPKPE